MDPPDPDSDPQHWLEGTEPISVHTKLFFKYIFGCLFINKIKSDDRTLTLGSSKTAVFLL
jgi:hypothetical protein